MKIKKYGWNPDRLDGRDMMYARKQAAVLQSVDLREKFVMPEIFDQGDLGSCTANAIAFCLAFNVLNNHADKIDPKCILPFSRLFIYYNERVIENSVKDDAGAEIRDGIKTVVREGACLEKLKPYNIRSFKRKPSKRAYKQALKFAAIKYERLNNQSKHDLVDCLLSGYPFVLGFTVYDNFESYEVEQSGIVPMPNYDINYPIGGHAVPCVGYDSVTDSFICANSYSTGWGQKGYFTIPAAYLCNTNLADDFWVVTTIL